MKLADYANIAQLVIAIATVGAVIAALTTTRKTLREVQYDRRLRQAPFLTFEPGGWGIPVTLVKTGLFIPGVNPAHVHEVFKDLKSDADTVQIKESDEDPLLYGRLINAGVGPALSVNILWVPEELKIGRDSFQVSSAKLTEPAYGSALNNMPAMPMMIAPGKTSEVSRLPSFIVMDIDRKLKKVSGRLEIACTDTSGTTYVAHQQFLLATDYQSEQPMIYVTFGDFQEMVISSAPRMQINS